MTTSRLFVGQNAYVSKEGKTTRSKLSKGARLRSTLARSGIAHIEGLAAYRTRKPWVRLAGQGAIILGIVCWRECLLRDREPPLTSGQEAAVLAGVHKSRLSGISIDPMISAGYAAS
jgi:hypothetical protein